MSFTIRQYKKDIINPGNTLVFIDSISYDYWDSFEKFFKKDLRRKDKFYKSLTDCAINDEGCEQHGIIIWKAFVMKNMKDFHDLYVKLGVLLFVCMFESVRIKSMNSFELKKKRLSTY